MFNHRKDETQNSTKSSHSYRVCQDVRCLPYWSLYLLAEYRFLALLYFTCLQGMWRRKENLDLDKDYSPKQVCQPSIAVVVNYENLLYLLYHKNVWDHLVSVINDFKKVTCILCRQTFGYKEPNSITADYLSVVVKIVFGLVTCYTDGCCSFFLFQFSWSELNTKLFCCCLSATSSNYTIPLIAVSPHQSC